MASLYFTTYGASVYYHFLPELTAFLIMVGLTVYTIISAMQYGRQEIAIFGMTGAYGIPFLISANAERVELFFSYILLINIGTVFLSFKKSWKLLGQLSMVITWMLFIGWEIVRFKQTDQLIAFVFMALYYLLFLVNALAKPWMKKQPPGPLETQQIIINNTILFVAVVLALATNTLFIGLRTASGGMFFFYGLLALACTIIFPLSINMQRSIAWQSLAALILYIGFEWSGMAVTWLWLLLSLALFVWGMLAKRSWPRLASVLLIGITLAKLIVFDSGKFSTLEKIISFVVIGVLLLILSFYYQRVTGQKEKQN
jgi:uncharacterized membrane protein